MEEISSARSGFGGEEVIVALVIVMLALWKLTSLFLMLSVVGSASVGERDGLGGPDDVNVVEFEGFQPRFLNEMDVK